MKRCPHCKGWAYEPKVYPLKNCGDCLGTGRETLKGKQRG